MCLRCDLLAAHDAEECAETGCFHLRAPCHLGMLLVYILVDGFPVQHSECDTRDRPVRVETEGEVDVSVALVGLLVEVDGAPHIFAGDNRAAWVENIAGNPNVRLKINEEIFELRAIRVTDAAVFETYAQAWKLKYGNRPRNERVDETYLFRLTPRAD